MSKYRCEYNGNTVEVEAYCKGDAAMVAYDDLHFGNGFLDLDAINVERIPNSIAREIRECRKAIAAFRTSSSSYRTQILMLAYNWATKPDRLTDDRENRVLSKFARCVRAELCNVGGWKETEDGRIALA